MACSRPLDPKSTQREEEEEEEFITSGNWRGKHNSLSRGAEREEEEEEEEEEFT